MAPIAGHRKNMKLQSLLSICVIVVLLGPTRCHGFWEEMKTSVGNFFEENKLASVAELMKNVTKQAWDRMKVNDLTNLGKDKLKEIMDRYDSLSERQQANVDVAYLTTINSEEIMNKLGEIREDTPGYELQTLLSEFNAPEKWTREDIKEMSYSVFTEVDNSFLLRIDNKLACEELLNKVKGKNKEKMVALREALTVKCNGSPDTWTAEELKNLEMKDISLPTLDKLDSELIKKADVQSKLKDFAKGVENEVTARMYLRKYFEVEGLKSEESPKNAKKILQDLGLECGVMPEDLSETVLKDNEVLEMVKKSVYNALDGQCYLSPMGSKMVMKQYANVSMQDIRDDELEMVAMVPSSSFYMMFKAPMMSQDDNNDLQNNDDYNDDYNDEDLFMKLKEKNKIKPIMVIINKLGQIDQRIKLDSLVDKVEEELSEEINSRRESSTAQISVREYDDEIISKISPGILMRVSDSEAKDLMRNENLDLSDMSIQLITRDFRASDFREMKKEVREYIPTKLLESSSLSELRNIAKGLPPGTTVGMMTVEKGMENKKKALMATDFNDEMIEIVPFFGKKEAMMVNSTEIFAVLKKIKDINPGFIACSVLADKVVNFTRNLTGDMYAGNPIDFLSVVDIENFPVCVTAAYGPDQIVRLSEESKRILLDRFAELHDSQLSIMRSSRMTIVKEGLLSLRKGGGLQPGDLESVGMAIADIPGEMLGGADETTKYNYIMALNNMTSETGVLPCLDRDQRSAIADMIMSIKGSDLSKWDTITNVSCLLFTISRRNLAKIPPEVMMSGSCKLKENLSPSQKSMKTLCKNDIGDPSVEDMMKDIADAQKVQGEASLNVAMDIQTSSQMNNARMNRRRTKRQTNSQNAKPCDRAAYSGALGFDIYELRELEADVVLSCIGLFCSVEMDMERAELIVENAENSKPDTEVFSYDEILDMRQCIKGFKPFTVRKKFPGFSRDGKDEVVTMLGSLTDLPQETYEVLSEKVFKTFTLSQKEVTREELMMINQIICGFSERKIRELITKELFEESVQVFANLKNCSREPILVALAEKAEDAYGDPSTWDKTVVADLGVVVGGLQPEEIEEIKAEAMEGLRPSAVEEFADDTIKSLDAEKVSYMRPETAFAFSEEQKINFSPDMKKALDFAKTRIGSSSERHLESPLALTAGLLVFVIRCKFD